MIHTNINTDSFKVASLSDYDRAVKIIEEAESSIAQLVGNEITLIAYEKIEGLKRKI
ncbi:hypothetical protein [Paenibacillus sp. 1_12]|uniref:hypothetical protein n=1 Tax=Paenibacillus sp. 1_12 TaxID=1566278 RepID=UPI0015A6F1AB|nr:hypothetical protein [Paenibacillus sp. 1_12]